MLSDEDKQVFEEECNHLRGQLAQKRSDSIKSIALQRLAQRQGRLTDCNTYSAVTEAIEHATRAYDAVMAREIPRA